jgi:undecaprenyl-diphosphatase
VDKNEKNPHQPQRPGASSAAFRIEFNTLLVAAIVASVVALAAIALAALSGGTQSFDEWLLRAMRSPVDPASPIGPRWLQELVRDISALGSTFVLSFAVAVVAGFLLVVGAPRKAGYLVAAAIVGTGLNRLLKLLVDRPRPDIVTHATYVSNESFPSGHTANSAIVYLLLGILLASVETSFTAKVYVFCVCALTTVMIGLSRIYLGVHWPSDVFAGWLLGVLWALLCWYVLVSLQPARTHR